MKQIVLTFTALTLTAFMPTQAYAQFSFQGNGATEITADDLSSQGNHTILRGQADIRQGDTRILADRVDLYTRGGGLTQNSSIDRVVAKGNFYYITPDQEVRGEQGVYQQASESFTVTGDVILVQGENVVTGDKLVYNMNNEAARVTGTCKGRKCGSKGRVKVLIKNSGDSTPAS